MDGGQQVALVTGAAGGLGREVARQLVEAGIRVIVTARRPEAADETAAQIGATALPVSLDVADPDSVASAAHVLESHPGGLDILVNNAAAFVDWSERVTGADLDDARRVLETNLFGAWRLTQALLPLLQRSASPRIVNVSSGAGSHGDDAIGLTPRGGAAASYGMSKAALNAISESRRRNRAGRITASSVAASQPLRQTASPSIPRTIIPPSSSRNGGQPIRVVPGVLLVAKTCGTRTPKPHA